MTIEKTYKLHFSENDFFPVVGDKLDYTSTASGTELVTITHEGEMVFETLLENVLFVEVQYDG